MTVNRKLTPKESSSRISDRAIATSKFPLPLSITVAVVSTLVCPFILPPTMIDAPTSEMTPPKPAITAARSGRRASRTSIRTIWVRVAPSASTCSLRLAGRFWIEAMVIPATIGVAITVWASTMADGV